MATLDSTTQAEYSAEIYAVDRAQAILDALASPVSLKIYNATDAVVASGAMTDPWATVSGGQLNTTTVDGLFATVTADPDNDWALRFESGSRYVECSFGVAGSGKEAEWSLGTFTVGTQAGVISGVISVTGEVESDWIYSTYAAFITANGGAPIPSANARYWDAPEYPTGGSAVAAGATISAAGTYYLPDGAHAGSLTINASDVTLYAQTRHGATITGNITVNGSRCDVMGIKWAGTSTSNPYCVDLNGTDNRVAYCLIPADFGPSDDSVNRHLIQCDGARSRVCYNTVLGWRGGGRFVDIVGTSAVTYCRVDHNYVSEMYCVDPALPDNEVVQVGQAQYGTDYFALIDNNYVYRWNNNGNAMPVAGVEAECFSIKSDANCIIANVFVGCHGTVNLRMGGNCFVFGNYWFGDGMATAGGIGIYGANHVIACNYFSNLNSGGSNNYAAFRIGNGADIAGDYYAARNVEISFNTTYNCRKPIVFSTLSDRAYPPTGTKFYNNAIGIDTASNAVTIVTAVDADAGTTWAGNVIEPTVGRAASGITAATPELTLANGVRSATTAGNCDGAAASGYSALIAVGAGGAAIGTDVGAFQSSPSSNPWQAIIDGAGA